MAQDGEINLGQVKASYSIEDIMLVDMRELSFVNESRLYYEISFGIGFTLVGSILGNFDTQRCVVAGIFLLFGIYNLIRYVIGSKKIKKRITKKNINSESGC